MIQRNLTRFTNFVINHNVDENGWYFSLLMLFGMTYVTATIMIIVLAFEFNVFLGAALLAFHFYHMVRWFYRHGKARAAELQRQKPNVYGRSW